MTPQISEEIRVYLRDQIQKPQMQHAKEELLRRCPAIKYDTNPTIEQAALQAARGDGYREAVRILFEIMPLESTPQGSSEFIETGKD